MRAAVLTALLNSAALDTDQASLRSSNRGPSVDRDTEILDLKKQNTQQKIVLQAEEVTHNYIGILLCTQCSILPIYSIEEIPKAADLSNDSKGKKSLIDHQR